MKYAMALRDVRRTHSKLHTQLQDMKQQVLKERKACGFAGASLTAGLDVDAAQATTIYIKPERNRSPQLEPSTLPIAIACHRRETSVLPPNHPRTEVSLPDLIGDLARTNASINISVLGSKAVDLNLQLGHKAAADPDGPWEDIESARAGLQTDHHSTRSQAIASAQRRQPRAERRSSKLRTVQERYGSPPPSPATPGSLRNGYDEALSTVQQIKPSTELAALTSNIPVIVVEDTGVEEVLA